MSQVVTGRPLAVLVVGYRRPDLLARCLAAVTEHLPGTRVLVWDNTGPDAPGRAELVAARPDVTWQLSDVNVGFAAAVNALARAVPGHDLLLLNPDAVLTGPLTATRAAVTGADVAAAAPRVRDDSQPGRTPFDVAHRRSGLARALVAHAGYAPRLRGTAVSDLYPAAPSDVEGYLTGACLLLARPAWDALGEFDEEFHLYGEEADWQRRARAAGWRLVLADEDGAVHRGHGTVAGDPAAERRSRDLLRANVALGLEHARGVHVADAYLAGTSVLDRVQRSSRAARAAARTGRAARTRPAVVLTINRLGYGGAERHHVLLAQVLRRRGHEVVIACMQRLGPLVREVPADVRVVRQPWWAPALDLGSGPAVVISGDTNTETGFAALWRRAGRARRWLVGAHIPPDPDGPTYGRALARTMTLADGFVALSPAHVAEVSAHQQVARRFFVAPNGVPLAGIAPRPDRRPRPPDFLDRPWRPDSPGRPRRPDSPGRPRPRRPVRLVMLTRVVEHKNPQLLVAALAGLTDLDWELAIHGDGPDRARLEALTPPELRDRVRWCGWSPGPDHALAGADLLCVPSRSEAFPLTIVEAMARGVPVIASAVCSVPDMLDHGRAGILVEPVAGADGTAAVTEASWREALRATLQRPGELAAVGRAGQARMRALYTDEAMTDAYEAAIDAVFEGADRPGG